MNMYLEPELERVLILGKTGFIGKNLLGYFEQEDMLEYEVRAVSRENKVDILNYEQISNCISNFKPHYIFNLYPFLLVILKELFIICLNVITSNTMLNL